MASSKAETVAQYLAELPEERRAAVSRVRALVRKHLPKGYQEVMAYGMIAWVVPLKAYPDTYNGQPLAYAALASQKNYMSLYLTAAYASPAATRRLKAGFAEAGKKLDMGKSCVRFRAVDDLAPAAVAEAVALMTPAEFIAHYEASRRRK